MGGEDSGVTKARCNCAAESAYFLPSSVRRTARTLNLPSDAAIVSSAELIPPRPAGFARATQLIAELAGGAASSETIAAGEVPAAPQPVTLRYQRCHQLLGVTIPPEQIDEMFADALCAW
jgi:phenylalanyl-tRNA synthetase beta chain